MKVLRYWPILLGLLITGAVGNIDSEMNYPRYPWLSENQYPFSYFPHDLIPDYYFDEELTLPQTSGLSLNVSEPQEDHWGGEELLDVLILGAIPLAGALSSVFLMISIRKQRKEELARLERLKNIVNRHY